MWILSVAAGPTTGAPRLRGGLLMMALTALVFACQAERAPTARDEGRFGTVEVFVPRRAQTGIVFLFSDVDGWNTALERVAQRLAARDALVVGVDLRRYLGGLVASDDGCHYVVAEIEDLSHRLERETDVPVYRSPLLAGVGAGATLAYAALAQSPAATVAGAAGVDPAPALVTKVPLCAGAPATRDPHGGFRYATGVPLPGIWRVEPARDTDVTAQLTALVTPMLAGAAAPGSIAAALPDVPLVEIAAPAPGHLGAIIYSGDGGWRDLDKTIGETLADRGVPVVGVDSLRYFWRAKTPERVAADLSAIISACRAAWGDVQLILIGYSFGADVLPFAVNRLPPADRGHVVEVSLLALEARARFEIEVTGWLGRAPSASALPVLPEVQRLDPSLLQCFYGDEETDSVCRDPAVARAEVIRTAGGHHFDGNYVGLADRILAGAERRMPRAAARGGPRTSPPDDASDAAGDEDRDVGQDEREGETSR